MSLPDKVVWADKVTSQPSTKPTNEKLTAQEANAVRDSNNSIIDYLPIHLYTDSNGFIKAPSDLNPLPLTLIGVHIGSIQGIGPTINFEYNATKNPYLDGTTFSKDLDEDTIMQAGTHTPMAFFPNSMVKLSKR